MKNYLLRNSVFAMFSIMPELLQQTAEVVQTCLYGLPEWHLPCGNVGMLCLALMRLVLGMTQCFDCYVMD